MPVLAPEDRNCVLVPSQRLRQVVRLPLIALPHDWHEDTLRRSPVVRPTGATNKGKKFPATPVYAEDADAILDALFNPERDMAGKWANKWGPIRQRNRTIMAVAKGTGLRIHELLLLRLSDINPKTCQLVVRRGKGGKRGLIAILPDAIAEIQAWVPVWRAHGFSGEDLLFPVWEGPTKGGMVSQAYVRVKLHEAAREAGVNVRAVPHQWRHGLAVELHRRGVPIGMIQRQLRHSSPGTTGIYLAGISADEVIETVVTAMAAPAPAMASASGGWGDEAFTDFMDSVND